MLIDAAYGVIPILPHPPAQEAPRLGSSHLYLLIQHQKGHWAFPKGHKDSSESDLEAAQRELREETGLTDYQLLTLPGQSDPLTLQEAYTFTDPEGNRVAKTVTYYVALLPPQFLPLSYRCNQRRWPPTAGAPTPKPWSRSALKKVGNCCAAAKPTWSSFGNWRRPKFRIFTEEVYRGYLYYLVLQAFRGKFPSKKASRQSEG
jgi:8-oxo-dGTP pyrophosphatase MutT (NUDIX family)